MGRFDVFTPGNLGTLTTHSPGLSKQIIGYRSAYEICSNFSILHRMEREPSPLGKVAERKRGRMRDCNI